jgi:two-component system, cell cycle sensor histidine kinase and response regulator CckA
MERLEMKSPIHILHLEDDPNDARLINKTLAAEGVTCAITVVRNRDDFVAALERGGIDLVLSDSALPDFDGMSALKIVHANWPAIPLILVSGTMGEQRAIDSLKSGATDYILKDNLSRMAPAVCRAMQEVEERTGKRRTEEALQESDQLLRTVFGESPMGIALVGVDGRAVLTNAALEKMLGYTGEELSRMSFAEFTHPEDCAKDLELYQELIQGARQGYELEKRYLRKDGQAVWARLSVSLARENAGHANFAIAMVEDMTERRRLEAQFIEAQKMEVVGHLASGVAHDFNNLLAVIMGYSDLVLMETGLNEALKGKLETIRAAAERAAGLTRQLLIFSRKQTVELIVLDVRDVLKDLDKILRRLIDENIKMTIAPGKQSGHIKADSGYVGQVLMNLVVNARDAMPKGGQLTIATNTETVDENYVRSHKGAIPGHYVVLSVSDTGTGMTEKVKAHLFEAFFTTKPKGKGTGLGLATCQTIVEQSGGFIDVSSEVGKGTTFKIYFPQVEQAPDVQAVDIQAKVSPRGTESLLVVEDDLSLRHLAVDVLLAQGYEVLSAQNGQEALHVMNNHKGSPIRLVITDVIMPLMGGREMSEWLKTTYPDLKILFTSGYTDDALTRNGTLPEELAFLPKPYTPAKLTHKVREMLDSASLQQAR